MNRNGVSSFVSPSAGISGDMPTSPLPNMPESPLTPLRVVGLAGSLGQPELTEGRALSGAQTTLAIVVALALIGLGVANIVTRARLHEVEDGVLWATRAQGVTAMEVAPGSAGAVAGVERGDVLLAVNGQPVRASADVIEFERRGRAGTHLSYTLLH